MPFRVVVTHEGNLRALLNEAGDNLKAIASAAIERAAKRMQDEYRAQARQVFTGSRSGGGKGQDVTKSIRARFFPNSRSNGVASPAASVYFNAPWWRAQIEGAVITARGGKWLVVALPPAIERGWDRVYRNTARGARLAKGANVAAAVAQFGKLGFVPVRGNRALLVARDKGRDVPLFLLLRQVTLRSRFDIDGPLDRAVEQALAEIGSGEL